MTDSRIATPVRPPRQGPSKHAALAAFVLLIPLVAGAVLAAVANLDPARSWTPAGEEPGAAPASVATAETSGPSTQELVDARRAAIDAQSQASLLASGAKQLADGTHKLKDGADGIGGGLDELTNGANELAAGMKELQAGTGELGSGANEVADTVGGAVDQVAGIGAVRGQLLAAIDDALRCLDGNKSPDAKKAQDQLHGLRDQVDAFQVDDAMKGDLQRLKDGSRELANQLSVSGYAYHDGIYEATRGAEQLNSELQGATGKAGEATSGIDQLDEGAAKIQKMAEDNRTRLESIQRALPAVQEGDDADGGQRSAVSPIVALLISTVAMGGGAMLGWAQAKMQAQRGVATTLAGSFGVAAAGEILLFVLASGVRPLGAVGAGVIFFLSALAGCVFTRGTLRAAGPTVGLIVAGMYSLAQLGIVGWVWKTATTQDVSTAWQAAAGLFPLHWATSAATTAGNAGQLPAFWIPAGLLAAAVVCGLGALALARAGQARAGEDAALAETSERTEIA